MGFEVKLALEGIVDRFDQLADGFQQRLAAPGGGQPRFEVERGGQDFPFADLGSASADRMGIPAGVQMRYSRSPQNQREWLAQ